MEGVEREHERKAEREGISRFDLVSLFLSVFLIWWNGGLETEMKFKTLPEAKQMQASQTRAPAPGFHQPAPAPQLPRVRVTARQDRPHHAAAPSLYTLSSAASAPSGKKIGGDGLQTTGAAYLMRMHAAWMLRPLHRSSGWMLPCLLGLAPRRRDIRIGSAQDRWDNCSVVPHLTASFPRGRQSPFPGVGAHAASIPSRPSPPAPAGVSR